ncbi:MAG: hypothetical protein R3F20_09935 [Planctomycetota bacterium]
MHTSTEVACQRMLTNLYTDPEILPILSEFVILPTCFDDHDEVEKDIGGTKMKVSPLFGTIGCENLRQNEHDVRKRYFESYDVKVPQHIFIGDDGKPYLTKIYELKKPDFITLLNNALVLYGSKAADGMDAVTKGFLEAVKKGTQPEKRKAVRGILALEDERKLDILYLTIQGIDKERDKGECVRAFGKDVYTWAAPTVMKWLRDPSDYVRNCAIVSLEEMRATIAGTRLIEMFPKERDKEIHKDILRALGPCGDGTLAAKEILVENVKDRREDNRIACYLSLGYNIGDADVQALLAERYKKEGKSVAAKTAILWAYAVRRDESVIPALQALVAKEKSSQITYLADAVERHIRTGSAVDPAAGRGGYMTFHKALGPIFTKDKIERNAYKYWRGDD